jgi:hypothetical protein
LRCLPQPTGVAIVRRRASLGILHIPSPRLLLLPPSVLRNGRRQAPPLPIAPIRKHNGPAPRRRRTTDTRLLILIVPAGPAKGATAQFRADTTPPPVTRNHTTLTASTWYKPLPFQVSVLHRCATLSSIVLRTPSTLPPNTKKRRNNWTMVQRNFPLAPTLGKVNMIHQGSPGRSQAVRWITCVSLDLTNAMKLTLGLDQLPILEARFDRLENAIDRYVDYRGQRALSNSILPGMNEPEGTSSSHYSRRSSRRQDSS